MEENKAYRQLPNASEIEISILSCILQWPELLDKAVELGLTSDAFYVPSHKTIFLCLHSLTKKGDPINMQTVSQKIKDSGQIENIGGNQELASIYTQQTTSAFFNNYCKQILEKFRLRSIISTCTEAIAEAYENPEDVDAFLDNTEKEVFSIRRGYSSSDAKTSDELLDKTLENLDNLIRGNITIEGLPTRFKLYNDLTKGFKQKEVTIIAARPSVGKTALMCNLITDLMIGNVSGLVFSVEMSDQQLMDRIFYGLAKFPMQYLKSGFSPTKGELQKMMEAQRALAKKNLFIDDTPAIKLEEVKAKTRRKKKEHDIKYFAVDYLQLMQGSGKRGQSREQEISEISGGLKALAKELEIPGIILAQLNRGPEKREQKIPRLSDLRESGAIEQDADVIGLLYRPDYYKTDEEEKESSLRSQADKEGLAKLYPTTLIIAKNRNGPTGEIDMKFNKEIMQFT